VTHLASWDGELVAESEIRISPFSATATYGINVFEGLRAYWRGKEKGHSVLFCEAHIRRLLESASILGIDHRFTQGDLLEALEALIRTAPEADVAVRMTLMIVGDPGESWGSEAPANLAIRYFPAISSLDSVKTARAMTSSWRRPGIGSMPMSVKSGANYLNSRYGLLQSRACGVDLPLFLDERGYVVEGGGANLICRKSEEVLFCSLEQPVLRGITQEYIKSRLADCSNYRVVARPITLPELYVCDEVLLVGTTTEVISIEEVDGRTVIQARGGELCQFVCECLKSAVAEADVIIR